MNNIDKQYQNLIKDILENGVKKQDRTGTGTISVFGRTIRHNMADGFPLLTTKKMYMKGVITELLWFLRGDTNIKYLLQNDCNIWSGDCYSNYGKKMVDIMNIVIPSEFMDKGWVKVNSQGKWDVLSKEQFINKIKTDDEFAKKWGELGPIYGKQWRSWSKPKISSVSLETIIDTLIEVGNGTTDEHLHQEADRLLKERDSNVPIDQIANLINDLKTNPDSRRLMVNAWNVGELDQMVLPPCHYGFQVYTRELSLVERSLIAGSNHGEVSQNIKAFTGIDEDHTLHKNLDDINIPRRAISLMYNARSQDVPLGTPFNIASYALLLEIIAKMVNMVPDELITNMGDCHIYLNQIDGVREQIIREPYPLPKLVISNQVNFNEGIDKFLDSCLITDFKLEGYQSHPTIKLPLSN